MTRFAVDSSALVTWILREPRWETVDRLLMNPDADPVLPGPGLAEVTFVARRRGNTSTRQEIFRALTGIGVRVVPSTEDDLLTAAELLELAVGPAMSGTGSRPSALSLGDALILATAERLAVPVVTRDRYWRTFVDLTGRPITVVTI